MNDNPILARIHKLLALAKSTVNEHEAASAAERAATLMAEHEISMAELRLTGGSVAPTEEISERPLDNRVGKRIAWHEQLAWGVTRKFHCPFFLRSGNIVFFGRTSNVQAAIYTMGLLNDADALGLIWCWHYGWPGKDPIPWKVGTLAPEENRGGGWTLYVSTTSGDEAIRARVLALKVASTIRTGLTHGLTHMLAPSGVTPEDAKAFTAGDPFVGNGYGMPEDIAEWEAEAERREVAARAEVTRALNRLVGVTRVNAAVRARGGWPTFVEQFQALAEQTLSKRSEE